MNTELYIENYRLDITKDISALLTFSLADIKDFSARSTTWSKTIVLPGTSNNNKLFGHIFQVGQGNEFDSELDNVGYNFNASKSADCIIFQDHMQTFRGVLRLMQMNIIDGRIEYEVSVFGKLAGLNVALSGAYLEDLDFSEYDHVYNTTNIIGSWDNPSGVGYFYPLIDYGTYSTNKHDWDVKTFRPALYVKEYIDKMFTAAGYRYSSDLFESTRFKKLIIPHTKKIMTVSVSDLYSASKSAPEGYTILPVGYPHVTGGTLIDFDTFDGIGFTPNIDNTVFTYAGTVTTNVTLQFRFEGTFVPFGIGAFGEFYIFKNGDGVTTVYGQGFTTTPFVIANQVTVSLAPGDTLEFRFLQRVVFGGFGDFVLNVAEFDVTSQGGTSVPVPISLGDTVQINDSIPKNIRQIDFLVGIVKLFNLYVYEDKLDTSLIYLTPYPDFYTIDNTNAVDWTYKLNRDKPIKVKPMSELTAKVYNFKFKPDSDYYNDLYRKRYSQGYGDRAYDSEYEFAEQEKSFEVIFSGTPLVGYGGEDKVYSTIFKRTGPDDAAVEENTDCNIRILQSKKVTGVELWDIKDGETVLNSLTRYGYAGHLNDPDAPSDDLNFGATRELFFILTTGNLSNNQFNVYWSSYMAEITDKNSKLLTAHFYLTPKDIIDLDFSKYVYVDGVLFRLNQIKDYNASNPSDCVVELLKVNYTNYTEAADNESPPQGNFLLWDNNETLDWDTSEELLYN